MSAADCFELGRQSYNNGDFYHTQLWMEEADKRLKREAKNETVDESDVLEYLAFSIYKQGTVVYIVESYLATQSVESISFRNVFLSSLIKLCD